MKRTAIFPGSFDPITLGHIDILQRAENLFDHIIIAIAKNSKKSPLFSIEQRIKLATDATKDLTHISVTSFNGLLVNFAKQQHATAILRGIRNSSDFDFEFQLAGMNRQLDSNIETIFLPASSKYVHVASSLIKEIASAGQSVERFVPKNVAEMMK